MGMFFQVVFTAIFILLVTTLAELVTVPFGGTLVRFRANYAPKGVQLDEEGGAGAPAHAGPVVRSYWAMWRRVRRLEGWRGLYKGFVPSMGAALAVTLFVWAFIGSAMPRSAGRYSAPAASPLQLLAYTAFVTLMGLPVTVLINRAIATPYLLPWLDPVYALRRLFTPTELRRPWVLYGTPGLLGAKMLHLGYVVLVLRSVRALLLPSVDALAGGDAPAGAAGVPADFTPLRIGTYLCVAGLSTAVLCPLEVLATRLSLQRNHATSAAFEAVRRGAGPGTQPQPQQEQVDGPYAGTEDVIGLRNEFDPYVGFTDAAKRMVDEEGWGALYRGWWITMLAGLLGIFA